MCIYNRSHTVIHLIYIIHHYTIPPQHMHLIYIQLAAEPHKTSQIDSPYGPNTDTTIPPYPHDTAGIGYPHGSGELTREIS